MNSQADPNGTKSPKAHESEPSYKRIFECFHCREGFEEVKMCGACKLVGYCSKTVWFLYLRLITPNITLFPVSKKQLVRLMVIPASLHIKFKDTGIRKEHKHHCKGILSGKPPTGRDLVMKVTERFMESEEIMTWVMSLLISVLDLANHPENATKYAVIIVAGTRPMITNSGGAVPQKKVPMLFKVLQATRFANADVELMFPSLKALSEDLSRKLDKKLQGAERRNTLVVRAVWASEANPSSVQMFCEHINHLQCAVVQGMKCTTEDFISHFNAQPELHPDIKEKFTIRTSIG